MYKIDFGINPKNVWVARLNPGPGGYGNPVSWNALAAPYYRRLLEQIEALPNVISASFTDTTPFFSPGYQADVALMEGGAERDVQARIVGIADGYFRTLGSKLIAGEDFRRGAKTGEASAILSESLARHFGGGHPVLGEHIRIGTSPDLQRLKIIGIARDMDMNLADLNDTKPFLAFVDFWEHQNLQGYPALLVKTRTPLLDAGSLRRIVERNGHEFVERLTAVSTEIDNALIENRFLAYLSAAFGFLALLMAGVALFGLLSYQVANRTSEIGIRMALGAQQTQIRWLVIGQAVRLLFLGIAAGIALTLGIQKLLASMLFGITVYDPSILFSAILVMGLAALLAATIPARRATRIDPIEALRHE